ncbi:MAG: 1,4-dihydroxy-2-naphthoate polyprenyltransferase [Melioribacteraceae bacterium]|nr:1,4-dihydroxy-2-naphthoate polyprenyltransferase [Melioribacteraceae bacterium]MCO6473715.1 1,4-dihydroxy-2-naphthoate polyprenyltransferase [Melioribacteraceae bacterium]MDD3558671.1 1,4-dihydroxy-2-naphthoate polyprenyltransferase [Melioribacteraceae bacterium]
MTASNNSSKLSAFILASRPKTLLASLVPVIVGSSAAYKYGGFKPIHALVALLCSVLIQVSTNFINDLYDFLSGKDTEHRVGPQRALASGLVSVKEMKWAIIIIYSVTFLLGLYLVYKAGIYVLVIGVLSLIAGYLYTAGPYPLAYNGLGDFFVLIFFGFVGTMGTFYVQVYELNWFSFWVSIPVGLLITNILVVNNYRDIDEDRSNNKNTLAVKMGRTFARNQYLISLILSYLILLFLLIDYEHSFFILLPLLTLPLAIKAMQQFKTKQGAELNFLLELSAKLSFLFGILFSAGIIL